MVSISYLIVCFIARIPYHISQFTSMLTLLKTYLTFFALIIRTIKRVKTFVLIQVFFYFQLYEKKRKTIVMTSDEKVLTLKIDKLTI